MGACLAANCITRTDAQGAAVAGTTGSAYKPDALGNAGSSRMHSSIGFEMTAVGDGSHVGGADTTIAPRGLHGLKPTTLAAIKGQNIMDRISFKELNN